MTDRSSGDEAFDLAFRTYGGRLLPEQIHPDTAPGFAEFVDHFNDVLRNGRGFAASDIRCDWVANLEFNAVATSVSDEELIGIFAGVPLFIYNHCYSFLSDPETLPQIGTTKRGHIEKRVLAALRNGSVGPLARGPRDPTRHDAAMHLAWNAVMFVFLHEMGHIVWGHLRLLSDYSGSLEYVELPMVRISNEEAHLRLLLELDADNFAGGALSILWRQWWDTGRFKALEPIGSDVAWCISLAMLFLAMDGMRPAQPPLGQSTHPSPLVRLINIARLGANARFPAFTGGEDAILAGLEAVNAWRERAGLPISEGLHGITPDVNERLTELRVELKDRYVKTLDQYAADRRLGHPTG